MITIKALLQDYLAYYQINRGAGHTQAVLKGAVNTGNTLLVCASRQSAEILNGEVDTVILFDSDKLRGFTRPLVWDNYALVTMFSMALTEINALDRRARVAEDKLCRIAQIAS